MEVVEQGSAVALREFVRDNVSEGTTIETDGGRCYVGIPVGDYSHEQTVLRKPEKASEVLPWVHVVISNAKRFLNGTFHSVSFERLQDYLNEFCYRLNRRWKSDQFERLIKAAIDPDIARVARNAVS
jgi:transposase-like protein